MRSLQWHPLAFAAAALVQGLYAAAAVDAVGKCFAKYFPRSQPFSVGAAGAGGGVCKVNKSELDQESCGLPVGPVERSGAVEDKEEERRAVQSTRPVDLAAGAGA